MGYSAKWDTIEDRGPSSWIEKALQCLDNAEETFSEIPLNERGLYRSEKKCSEAYGALYKGFVVSFTAWIRYFNGKNRSGKKLKQPKFIADFVEIADTFPAKERKVMKETISHIYTIAHVEGYYQYNVDPMVAASSLKIVRDFVESIGRYIV
jgi:hypothetical protein